MNSGCAHGCFYGTMETTTTVERIQFINCNKQMKIMPK